MTTTDPQVSVVICNWNSKQLLDQCLESLEAHRPPDVALEVIVVDNGSRDGSAEHIRTRWPDVRLLALEENIGFAAGNNLAFQHARGRYFLLLNADTLLLPSTIPGLIRCLEEDPAIGIAGARHLNADGSLQWSMDNFPSLLVDTLHHTDLYRLPFLQPWLRRMYPRWSDHTEPRDVDWVNGACLMVRREVVEATQGFDPYFFIYAEELDWCLRIWRAGWRVRFEPRAEIVHLLGGTFSSKDTNRLLLLYQSVIRYYAKHYSRRMSLSIRLVFLVNSLARCGAIAALAAARAVGYRQSAQTWELVAQVPPGVGYAEAIKAWARIPWLSPTSPIRPTAPDGGS